MKINNDTIIKDDENESILRVHSEDVAFPLSPEDEDLIKSLYKYVDDSGNEEIAKAENLRPAVGIAAPQVGVHKKMLAIILKDEE
ncbi:MAG: peptide deformylase, partial [Erysipelotrichaceae bacterium]|nr:peptide deformylase [Erysipelotrichaceae bacterium]